MRLKALIVGIMAAGIVGSTMGASEAWAHGRVFIGVGPYWGWGWGAWGYGAPYYPYRYAYPYGYPYGAYPGMTVVEQPRTYIQQPAVPDPPPAAQAPAPAPSEGAHWYYCPSSREYYPNVPSCSEPWLRVPARTQ